MYPLNRDSDSVVLFKEKVMENGLPFISLTAQANPTKTLKDKDVRYMFYR